MTSTDHPKPAAGHDAPAVLFVSHNATRSGAPLLLLRLLKWIQAHTDLRFEVMLVHGGELEAEFRAIAPTQIFRPNESRSLSPLMRLLRRLKLRRPLTYLHNRKLRRYYQRANIDIVYSNTFANGYPVRVVSLGRRVITHVHELRMAIEATEPENLSFVLKQTNQFIAVSHAVANNLVERLGINPSIITQVYGFTETVPPSTEQTTARRAAMRRALKLPPDAFVVGAAGVTHWHKGPDLFIQLARAVRSMRPDAPIFFVWFGGDKPGTLHHRQLSYDLDRLQLGDRVQFLEPTDQPGTYFEMFDVFALMSREDSFALVALEGAAHGLPVLCFESSGGCQELVGEDAGFVVPYLDVSTMAKHVCTLHDDRELCRHIGEQARAKIRGRFTVDATGGAIVGVIMDQRRAAARPS